MVKFLHDTPADVDFFGPHSVIAKAILDTVCVDHRLRIIGLSGSWGSGKSTVIRQLAKMLIDDTRCENYIFFEYDAWLTQNDPPRRSFMEALIPFLIEKEVLDKAEWDRKLDILKGKLQESTKITTPILTWKSVVFLKTYLLLAIGLFALNKVDLKSFLAGTATDLDKWSLGIGIGLVALAPLAMIAIYIRERFIEKLAPDQRSVVPRLLNKSIDTNRETTTRLLEPTSIEFRDEFRDIMTRVGAKKYRLMIVLDNVDRLSDEEALSLWSTMRSFFVDRLGQDFSVTHAPIVIVPVDIGSLTRVFVKDRTAGQQGREIAQSYIDKTFDVVFDVREPAISDWRGFFDDAFETAIGDKYKSWDIHQARRVYEAYALGTGLKTTPRAVIRLANAVAAIVSTSADIPLATIIVYVLNKSTIEDGISNWVSNKYLNYAEFDPEWKLNIAALHFMTDRNKAAGPLMKDDVSSAIIGESVEKIIGFKDIRGLGDVIAEIAGDPPVDQDGTLKLGSLATIVTVLQVHGATIHGSPLWREEAEASLAKSFLKLGESQPDLSKLPLMMEYLGSLDTDLGPVARTAANLISQRLSTPTLDGADLDVVVEGLDALKSLMSRHDLGELAITVEGETKLALARQFGVYRRSKNWKCIEGPSDHREIEEVLATRLANALTQSSVPGMIRMLSLSDDQRLVLMPSEDSPLLEAISAIVGDSQKSDFLASATDAMTELELDSPDLADMVEGWKDQGELTSRFVEAVTADDPERVWALIALGIVSGVYFQTAARQTWPTKFRTTEAVGRALNLMAKCSEGDQIDLIWKAIREWDSINPLLYTLRNQLIGGLDPNAVDPASHLKDYQNMVLQGGRAPFLNFLTANRGAETALAQLAPSELAEMLGLPNISDDTRTKILKAIADGVLSASNDEWAGWIRDGTKVFSHWEGVKNAALTRLGKRSSLATALQLTAGDAVASSSVLRRWLQSLELGNSFLRHDANVGILRRVAELRNAASILSNLKVILPTDASIQAQDQSWVTLLALIILHEDGRKWIDANSSSLKKRVKAFKPLEAKALRNQLENLAKDRREGRRLWAQRTLGEWFRK